MQEGDFVKCDAVTAEKAQCIRLLAEQNNTSILHEISTYLQQMGYDTSDKKNLFRKRTASEIIASGFQTGCTDRGVVFLALAKELGIQAFYVETFKEKSLGTPSMGMEGHVFVQIYDKQHGQWQIYEPINGFQDAYTLDNTNYIPVSLGRDHSVAYLLGKRGDPLSPPQRLDSEDALCQLAHNIKSHDKWTANLGNRTGWVK